MMESTLILSLHLLGKHDGLNEKKEGIVLQILLDIAIIVYLFNLEIVVLLLFQK